MRTPFAQAMQAEQKQLSQLWLRCDREDNPWTRHPIRRIRIELDAKKNQTYGGRA